MKNTERITFEGTVTLYQIGLAAGSRETLETVLKELDVLARVRTPARRDIWMLRFDCLINLKRWKELLDLSFSLEKQFGGCDKDLLRARATAYEGNGNTEKSIESLDEALDLYPQDPDLASMRKRLAEY